MLSCIFPTPIKTNMTSFTTVPSEFQYPTFINLLARVPKFLLLHLSEIHLCANILPAIQHFKMFFSVKVSLMAESKKRYIKKAGEIDVETHPEWAELCSGCFLASISSQTDIWEHYIFLVENFFFFSNLIPNIHTLLIVICCLKSTNIIQHYSTELCNKSVQRHNCTLTSRNINTLFYFSKHLINYEAANTLVISCIFYGLTLPLFPLSFLYLSL